MTNLVYGRIAQLFVAAVVVGSLFFGCQLGNAHAKFTLQRDSFSISNAPGWCFAMAAFARWYYLTHQDAAPLRSVFDKRSQQRIAKELQGFYSRNLIRLQADYCNQDYRQRVKSFRRFVLGLTMGEPRIVLLMNKGPRGAVLHAVLAYAWIPESNILKVYDPNYNNQERVIDLEQREYTSLDITYDAFCFPEVFHSHPALLRKMEALCASWGGRKIPSAAHDSGARPRWRNAKATRTKSP